MLAAFVNILANKCSHSELQDTLRTIGLWIRLSRKQIKEPFVSECVSLPCQSICTMSEPDISSWLYRTYVPMVVQKPYTCIPNTWLCKEEYLTHPKELVNAIMTVFEPHQKENVYYTAIVDDMRKRYGFRALVAKAVIP